MRSGIYTFDQLILDVKDETGYENLANRHAEIKRLILRAERDINPFGSALVLKKMRLYSANDNFDGTRFRKEDDFMFLHKMGCCAEGMCEGDYYETISHVIICDGEPERDEITYVYWAIQTDENGNPFTTYNHSEAVVKFIIWKILSQRYMLKEVSRIDVRDAREEYEDIAAFSRGEDFFPSEKELDKMLLNNQREKMDLFTRWVRGEDGCIECSCLVTEEEVAPDEAEPSELWYFQFDDTKEPNDEINIIDDAWLLANATLLVEADLLTGANIPQVLTGRLGFVAKTTLPNLYQIFDPLGLNITTAVFIRIYDPVSLLDIYISNTIYTNGLLYFKFEK